MGIIQVNEDILKAAVYGGAVLGCGGGGKIKDGLDRGTLALSKGNVVIVPLEYLSQDDIIITASSVGSPKSQHRYIEHEYYVRAVELFTSRYNDKIKGIVSSENGAAASVNGWIQAASLGLLVIDAPCNGHAHPTGDMGSMGLHKLADYLACEAVVGGNKNINQYFEFYTEGDISSICSLSRYAATLAGGVVATARNPVSVLYASKHAAVGGLSYAIEIGNIIIDKHKRFGDMLYSIANYMQGEIIVQGMINKVVLETKNSLDVGMLVVGKADKNYNIYFINEYMAIDFSGKRLATFPDLITLFSVKTGLPVGSAELAEGMEVTVLVSRKENIPLGYGMFCPELYLPLEDYLDIQLRKYVFR